MLAGHELKILNLSVIVYILAGALIFHSLGEFEPRLTHKSTAANQLRRQGIQPLPQISGSSNGGGAVDLATKEQADNGRRQQPTGPIDKSHTTTNAAAARLRLIRLNSVQRMWNITNQLNILYESNWTELVLNELLDYERLFIDSLELATANSADWPADGEESRSEDNKPADDGQQQHDGGDDDGDRNEDKSSKRRTDRKSPAGWARRNEQRIRMESIRRSLVHSLATITTMGE
jgi:hypothetical protein